MELAIFDSRLTSFTTHPDYAKDSYQQRATQATAMIATAIYRTPRFRYEVPADRHFLFQLANLLKLNCALDKTMLPENLQDPFWKRPALGQIFMTARAMANRLTFLDLLVKEEDSARKWLIKADRSHKEKEIRPELIVRAIHEAANNGWPSPLSIDAPRAEEIYAISLKLVGAVQNHVCNLQTCNQPTNIGV